MNILKEIVKNIYTYLSPNVFKDYIKDINKTNNLITNISSKSSANLLFSLCALEIKPVALIVEDSLKAEEMLKEIEIYNLKAEILNPKEFRNFDVESESRDIYVERMRVIRDTSRKRLDIVIIPIKALIQKMVNVKEIVSSKIIFDLKNENSNLSLDETINKLIKLGYKRETKVENEGTFALKGGILDIGLNKEKGVRIEFWGDEIDSIRKFNILNQRSTEISDFIEIYPAYENIISEENKTRAVKLLKESLEKEKKTEDEKKEINEDIEKINNNQYFNIIEKYFDYFYEKSYTFLDFLIEENINIFYLEIQKIAQRVDNIEKDRIFNEEYLLNKNKIIPYYFSSKNINYLEIFKNIYLKNSTYLNMLNLKNKYLPKNIKEVDLKINEKDFGKDFKTFILNIKKNLYKYRQIIIFSKKANEVKELLEEININSNIIENKFEKEFLEDLKKKKYFTKKIKSEKKKYEEKNAVKYFEKVSNEENNILIYPENMETVIEIENANLLFAGFEKTKQKTRKMPINKTFRDSQKVFFGDLKPGDFVVHRMYGIGKFLKIDQVTVMGITKEYLKLEYANKNYLYVPIQNADVVRKYIGGGTENLKLNSLNSNAWEKTKENLKNNLRKVAGELIRLYSEREKTKGYAFQKDDELQKEFENDFQYIETNDQLKCIEEIKEDMEKEKPMDRLLCGDVGFGKTEVAQRAAFKAILEGKQVAYLAPTTILVKQQYDGFKERFKKFPVNIDFVSRMKTKKENAETLENTKEGKIDILIGTHRLLSSDVSFKDLGLLIIDEEHRFGVKAKEKIKFLKTQVDVLSMSATPIPRTLSMSLSGIRDMSVIYEPPKNRKAVKTFLLEYDKSIIDEAILNEIERGGQVFYIHNRIQNIAEVYEELQKRLPNIKFGVAHGRMSSKEIEKVMEDFVSRKIDVLISTSIIETGIDIENANTLIIEDADKMGLAQLYQIRGRVGRGKRKAYAYLTFKKDKALSENAEKRLKAIKDFTELGSGYKIALRDLEIRGAGSVLGEMQHGHMEQVGYDMYVRILNQVIAEMKNQSIKKDEDVKIDLEIESYIPDSYIKEKQDKIEIYQKIADSSTEEEYSNLKDELIDRYGSLPQEIIKLIEISKIKYMILKRGINKIKQNGNFVKFYTTEDFNPDKFLELAGKYSSERKYKINKLENSIEIKLNSEKDIDRIKEIQDFLNKI